jgi:transposase
MEKIDARKHSPKTQFEIRKQVVRLRKQGIANKTIAEGLGITERTASGIWQKFLREGESAIKLGRRGRRKGEQRKLTDEQESQIKKAITDKTPDQLKLSYALWNREAIQLLMKQQLKLDVPVRTITDYLKRWGFSFQKPAKQAYEQKPEAVQKWLDEDYPVIKEQAKQDKAEILIISYPWYHRYTVGYH